VSALKLAMLSEVEKEMKLALNAIDEEGWKGPPLLKLHPSFHALK